MALDLFLEDEDERRKKLKEIFGEFVNSVKDAKKKFLSQLEQLEIKDEWIFESIEYNVNEFLRGIYDLLF